MWPNGATGRNDNQTNLVAFYQKSFILLGCLYHHLEKCCFFNFLGESQSRIYPNMGNSSVTGVAFAHKI